MILTEEIKAKFKELINSGNRLKYGNEHNQVLSVAHAAECIGWLTSAQNLIYLIINSPSNPYRKSVDKICEKDRGYVIQESVGEIYSILVTLQKDIEHGLLSSVENQAFALTFDSFLDHAIEYSKDNRKNESGVIAGVVFEDSLRTICRNNHIVENGIKLDELITELQKKEIFTPQKAKRARAAADVRTKATHADWDNFDLDDVKTTIEFTKQIINKHLDEG